MLISTMLFVPPLRRAAPFSIETPGLAQLMRARGGTLRLSLDETKAALFTKLLYNRRLDSEGEMLLQALIEGDGEPSCACAPPAHTRAQGGKVEARRARRRVGGARRREGAGSVRGAGGVAGACAGRGGGGGRRASR